MNFNTPVVCVEVLVVTVLVWIALFGIFELGISQIDRSTRKLAVYLVVLVVVGTFVCVHDGFSSCVLL